MKRSPYRFSLPVKSLVTVVGLISCFACFWSILMAQNLIKQGVFTRESWDYYGSQACQEISEKKASYIANTYFIDYLRETETGDAESYSLVRVDEAVLAPDYVNFRYTLSEKGTVLLSSHAGGVETFGKRWGFLYTLEDPVSGEERTVSVDIDVLRPFAVDDEFSQDAWRYEGLYRARYGLLVVAFVSLVVLILATLYLLMGAGKKQVDGREELVQSGLHVIPLDIFTIGAAVLLITLILRTRTMDRRALLDSLVPSTAEALLYHVSLMSILACCLWALVVYYCVSIIIRMRLRSLRDEGVLTQVARGAAGQLQELYVNRTLLGRSILWIVALALFTAVVGLWIVRPEYWWILFLYVLFILAVAIVLINFYQRHQKKVRSNIHRIAEGDLSTHIDTEKMRGAVKLEAEELNRINDAIQEAINERLKSERLKTELITNVTHDIKTPLTSIISYVDLLQRSGAAGEGSLTVEQQEYLAVLESQAVRLKKLIEDLIEASKASTGNVAMNLTVLDLREMLEQAAAEYQERLEEKHLTLAVHVPGEELYVVADGENLWRVLDNLLSNAEKYSLPGSTVVLDMTTAEGAGDLFTQLLGNSDMYADETVSISITNESSLPLDKSEEELMERFVRGDASRHTEGSGLGLSIAKSLTELMGGQFTITTDPAKSGEASYGSFKATVTLLRA